ncbi:hypothetical protein BACCAP_04437 [Pseudoflavonifractor capillosus ATCC 29799]|uniref:Uncharacterized protein n=1 Tax=Pseudoflavonifractor capillosus ATCC 29799 TaxID=411467 RepID=A6P1R5_9FIRM|nr:hypothetical protein BACCAP_04437 [Pseudoflavonifractor capillosus ATCC 29799]
MYKQGVSYKISFKSGFFQKHCVSIHKIETIRRYNN